MTEPKILHLWTKLDFNKIGKNKQHAINLSGKKKIVNTNNDFMQKLIYEISMETKVQKIQWENVKTWLFIHLTKISEKGDAINCLDVLADCCKKGIGVDDNKFATIVNYDVNSEYPYPMIHFWIIQASGDKIIEFANTFLKSETPDE